MYFLKKRVAKSIIGMCVCVVMVAKNIKYFFATLATTFFATLKIYYYKIKYSKYSVINKNFTAYYQNSSVYSIMIATELEIFESTENSWDGKCFLLGFIRFYIEFCWLIIFIENFNYIKVTP